MNSHGQYVRASWATNVNGELFSSVPEPEILFGNVDLYNEFIKSNKVPTIKDLKND